VAPAELYMLGVGRLINLAAAEGHPASVVDMSSANQALASEYLVKNASSLKHQVYSVPENADRHIAKLQARFHGHPVDKLTPDQRQYLASWFEGT
jgi:adenosylhomocysteinase